MKKRSLLLLLAALTLIFQLMLAYSQSGVGIGLQITDTAGPVIKLNFPLNNSGNGHGNVTFAYNASDASIVSNCSLIINNQVNSTKSPITKDVPMFFELNNSPIGFYNWSINCTDMLGFVGASPRRIVIIHSFRRFNGSTSNLSSFNIRNITNFVVEVTTSGKINFSSSVDLSQGFDLDSHINISFNRIEVNSSAIPNLNVSATLQLEGLTFSNPRILFDGNVCPDSICKKISYSGGGTLIFNVSHFTSYQAEETPTETPAETPAETPETEAE